jgi:hypothetical protein
MYEERMLTDDQKEFKKWLVYNPMFESEIDKHMDHFILKLYEIMKYYDTLPSETQGVRRFSLLPKKGGFVGSFFLIDETTLPQILKLLDPNIQIRIIQTLQSQCEGTDEWSYLDKRLGMDAIFPTDLQTFKEISHALWHVVFEVSGLETVNRKFRYLISTNGYAATVYLQKPKQIIENDFDSLPPIGTEYVTYIGLDPGSTYVATAFDGAQTVQVSNKEIRFDAKFTHHRKWELMLRSKDTKYACTLASLPSLKTANLVEFSEAVKETIRHSTYLFEFCEKKAFRAWRFKMNRFSKKAYAKAADKILGRGKNPDMIVGFGDWSQQDGFVKGHDKPGVKRLRKEMRTRCRVVKVDEFRTSMTCSCCQGQVSNHYYNQVKSHQIVRCTNNECNMFWQRDWNASRNMRAIVMTMVNREDRPRALKRTKLG